MCHGDVRDQATLEEAAMPGTRAIDELVHHHEAARRQFLLERADGAQRQDLAHPRALQDVDVGPIVDRPGREPVTAAVTRKEYELLIAEPAEEQLVRRISEGGRDGLPAQILQTLDVV